MRNGCAFHYRILQHSHSLSSVVGFDSLDLTKHQPWNARSVSWEWTDVKLPVSYTNLVSTYASYSGGPGFDSRYSCLLSSLRSFVNLRQSCQANFGVVPSTPFPIQISHLPPVWGSITRANLPCDFSLNRPRPFPSVDIIISPHKIQHLTLADRLTNSLTPWRI